MLSVPAQQVELVKRILTAWPLRSWHWTLRAMTWRHCRGSVGRAATTVVARLSRLGRESVIGNALLEFLESDGVAFRHQIFEHCSE